MAKNAVVVLTKGYPNIKGYTNLINRNRYISVNFYQKLANPNEYDIIIFHEGNISEKQQQYIQSQSPRIPLSFRTVEFVTNNSVCALCPPTELSNRFSMGYKNMCYFWAIRFLNFLKDYDYIIRIDEDCKLFSIDSNIINNYKENNIVFSSPYFQGEDDAPVVVGMHNFFNRYLNSKNITPLNTNITCPYTNVMIFNIPYFNSNNVVKEVLALIENTNCIFSNRWGDLPIWGYILSYLIDKKYYVEDKNIKYFHGSHDKTLN